MVSVIAWKRWPPCTAVTALPTVVPPEAVVSVKFSARLPSVPTPLLPLASPAIVLDVERTRGCPTACAAVSAGVKLMPLPGELTAAPVACAAVSAGETVIPLPRPRIDAPAACALVSAGLNVTPEPGSVTLEPTACPALSAGVNVTPVPALERSITERPVAWTFVRLLVNVMPLPVAPAVPTVWIVADSWLAPGSSSRTSPAARPVMLATLMLFADGETGSVIVVFHGAMPYAPESDAATQLESLKFVDVQLPGLLDG